MRFKIDENLPVATARILSDAGHESKTVHDQRMAGAPDRRLAEVCREEDRVLVTLDLDFSDIRAYPPANYPGIIILRPHVQERRPILDLLRSVLPLLHKEELEGYLWILVDTGPLVALLRADDMHHKACVAVADQVVRPGLTFWPVLTESARGALAEFPPRGVGDSVQSL